MHNTDNTLHLSKTSLLNGVDYAPQFVQNCVAQGVPCLYGATEN